MKPEFEGRRRGTGWSVAKGLAGRKLLLCAAVTVALSGCSSAAIPSTSGSSAGVPASVAATTKPSATATLAGTFTKAATPLVAAYFSASVPLKTGQVLFVGGCANYQTIGPSFSSAELYDPQTGGFTMTGSMKVARCGPRTTLLDDGRVLVAGGSDEAGNYLDSAEIYDPTAGEFADTGVPLGTGLDNGVLLRDGKVLFDEGGSKRAELFDPATGKFKWTGSLHTSADYSYATTLADGRVLFTGFFLSASGDLPDRPSTAAEIYNPATGTFTATGSMKIGREDPTIVLLNDGRVLVAGGIDASGTDVASAELYDPQTGKFTYTGSMLAAQDLAAGVLLDDGRVLIADGEVQEVTLTDAEVYDLQTGKFSLVGNDSFNTSDCAALLLRDGTVLFEGVDQKTNTGIAALYHP